MIEDSALGLSEVAYHNEPSLIFLGGLSIVRLSTGRLIASHEYFTFLSINMTHIYLTTLFIYNNMIYAIGIDNALNGNIMEVIRV
jgi:hypothetical protein